MIRGVAEGICVVLLISQVEGYSRAKPGDPCGRPYGSKRWMRSNGLFGCYKCNVDEYWSRRLRMCENCAGLLTNLKLNVRTSCKDERVGIPVAVPNISNTVKNETKGNASAVAPTSYQQQGNGSLFGNRNAQTSSTPFNLTKNRYDTKSSTATQIFTVDVVTGAKSDEVFKVAQLSELHDKNRTQEERELKKKKRREKKRKVKRKNRVRKNRRGRKKRRQRKLKTT